MDAKTQRSLSNVIDLLLDTVFLVDEQGCIVYVSAACERIFGYTQDEMIGRVMIDLVAPEDRAKTREEALRVMAGQPRIGFENRYIRKDGSLVHIMWSARWSEADRLRIGVARDVTELRRAEDLQTATYAISEAVHTSTDLVALFQEIHHIVARLVSAPGFAVALLDAKSGQLSFPYRSDLPDGAPAVLESVARALFAEVVQGGQPALLHSEALAAAGGYGSSYIHTSWIAAPLTTQHKTLGALFLKSSPGIFYVEKDKELLQFVSTQVVIAIERKRLNAELLHAARFDDLTGLPNRRLFHDRMKSALARARRRTMRLALLYIDLDDFKPVNDTFGHTAGDLLLHEVALRLQQSLREEDTVARLGGDEFAVLLEEVHSPEAVALVAEKIHARIQDPININGHVFRTRSSIGIALYPEHGDSEEQLLMHADKAMYAEKKGKIAAEE